jgi:hypothetical protein
LRDIIRRIQRHVVISYDGALATALWVMLSWVHDEVATHSPILNINSAEPESGKTTTIGLVAFLMPKCIASVEASEAAIFRAIKRWSPSFCFDEFDSILESDDKAALRSIINSGHTRGQGVLRCIGDDKVPELFPTFAPKAIGMVGRKLPPATLSRCIFVELRRRKRNEQVEKFAHADDAELADLRRRLRRWALDNQDTLREVKPAIPDELLNRRGDNWKLQLAIADLCDGAEEFGAKARAAAVRIETGSDSRTASARALPRPCRTHHRAGPRRPNCHPACQTDDRGWPHAVAGRGPATTRRGTRASRPGSARRERAAPLGQARGERYRVHRGAHRDGAGIRKAGKGERPMSENTNEGGRPMISSNEKKKAMTPENGSWLAFVDYLGTALYRNPTGTEITDQRPTGRCATTIGTQRPSWKTWATWTSSRASPFSRSMAALAIVRFCSTSLRNFHPGQTHKTRLKRGVDGFHITRLHRAMTGEPSHEGKTSVQHL